MRRTDQNLTAICNMLAVVQGVFEEIAGNEISLKVNKNGVARSYVESAGAVVKTKLAAKCGGVK